LAWKDQEQQKRCYVNRIHAPLMYFKQPTFDTNTTKKSVCLIINKFFKGICFPLFSTTNSCSWKDKIVGIWMKMPKCLFVCSASYLPPNDKMVIDSIWQFEQMMTFSPCISLSVFLCADSSQKMDYLSNISVSVTAGLKKYITTK